MSDNNKFENLPNELLIHIFEYTDIRDLYCGFWKLNQRINNLLQSLKNLSYNLELYEPILISLFSHQINRLIVNTWQDIDLHQFPYLNSLILHQVTANQLRQIQSDFMPHLIHLSTLSIPEFSLMPQLAQRIFSNEIPSLRHIDLGLVDIPNPNTWSQSPTLSSVSIRSNNPRIISFILVSCLNLIYFHIYFVFDTTSISHNYSLVPNHPLKQFILSDPYHKLSFNHIFTILGLIPNVRKLELNFLCKTPFIHFAQCLANRLRYLKEFNCNIDDGSNDKLTDIEIIRQIHPCFSRIYSTNDLFFRAFITE